LHKPNEGVPCTAKQRTAAGNPAAAQKSLQLFISRVLLPLQQKVSFKSSSLSCEPLLLNKHHGKLEIGGKIN